MRCHHRCLRALRIRESGGGSGNAAIRVLPQGSHDVPFVKNTHTIMHTIRMKSDDEDETKVRTNVSCDTIELFPLPRSWFCPSAQPYSAGELHRLRTRRPPPGCCGVPSRRKPSSQSSSPRGSKRLTSADTVDCLPRSRVTFHSIQFILLDPMADTRASAPTIHPRIPMPIKLCALISRYASQMRSSSLQRAITPTIDLASSTAIPGAHPIEGLETINLDY